MNNIVDELMLKLISEATAVLGCETSEVDPFGKLRGILREVEAATQ